MSNSGFKGTVVGIESIEIASKNGMPVINVNARFEDADGVVHAVVRHSFGLPMEPDAENELYVAAKNLMDAVTRQVETAHFETPRGGEEKKKVLNGIAELLRETDSADRELVEQG